MASYLLKNGILSGRLDHYCLTCEKQFKTEDETLAHIVDFQHKENWKTVGYFEKYKKDCIIKIKGIYFCEPCSLTFPTATKVELHIDEQCHLDNKKKINPWLKRVENDIVAFNQFIISDDAWNGCVEDTCLLCNIEFDDRASHKIIRSHVLNLINSEVVFDDLENTVVRTIDDRAKQCLTCNVITGNDPTSHFRTAAHKLAYKLYDPTIQKNETKNTTQTYKTPTDPTQNVKEVNKTKSDKKDDIKVVNGNINGDINKEAGKHATKDVKQDTDEDDSKNVKKDANKDNDKKVKKMSKQSAKKENAEELDKIYCKNLGTKNYITDVDDKKWCFLCELIIDGTPEGHILGKHHQIILKFHKDRLAGNRNNTSSKDNKFQNGNVIVDMIKKTAYCKKCSKYISFDTAAIEKHIDEHENTSVTMSPEASIGTGTHTKPVRSGKGKRSQTKVSVGDYAKEHGIRHNRADNSYYCLPCTRRLSCTLDALQKHVASRIHKENMQEPDKADTLTEAPLKKPLVGYVESFEIFDIPDQGNFIIINDKFCLNSFGFFLIAKVNEIIICYGCDIDLTPRNVLEHMIMTPNHTKIINKCLMITSLENEFIREIKLDVYHCGYCNIREDDWDDILDHIATAEHKREKAQAEQCLRQHIPNPNFRVNVKDLEDMVKKFARFQVN